MRHLRVYKINAEMILFVETHTYLNDEFGINCFNILWKRCQDIMCTI